MKKQLRFLLSFLRQQPANSKNFTANEMIGFIRGSISQQELSKIQAIASLSISDYSNTDFQKIMMEIMYQRMLFISLDASFKHDFYPTFAIMQHIALADSYIKLDTVRLHLSIYGSKYRDRGVTAAVMESFYREIAKRKSQLIEIIESEHDTTL